MGSYCTPRTREAKKTVPPMKPTSLIAKRLAQAAANAKPAKSSKNHASVVAFGKLERIKVQPTSPKATPQPQKSAKVAPKLTVKKSRNPLETGDIKNPDAELGKIAPADRKKFEELLVAAATNKETALLLQDHLAPVMWAILRGSRIPGTYGAADRQVLFRILGLPWTTAAAHNQPSRMGDLALGTRLGLALARREASRGQPAVTIDHTGIGELASDGGSEGVAHKIVEHGRYPEASDPVDQAVDGSRPAGGSPAADSAVTFD